MLNHNENYKKQRGKAAETISSPLNNTNLLKKSSLKHSSSHGANLNEIKLKRIVLINETSTEIVQEIDNESLDFSEFTDQSRNSHSLLSHCSYI